MNTSKPNLAFIDVETTGLDPSKHEIIDIGVVLVDSETRLVLSSANFKTTPERIDDADPIALKVNGYTKEDWADAISLKDALTRVAEITRGAYLMAYNVSFDYSFLQAAFQKTGVRDTMRYQRLDVLTLAWLLLPDQDSLSLKNVCIALDIEPEPEIHTAENGALKAFEVYSALMTKHKATIEDAWKYGELQH